MEHSIAAASTNRSATEDAVGKGPGIQRDIDAHRELPFDEDRERARLMPV